MSTHTRQPSWRADGGSDGTLRSLGLVLVTVRAHLLAFSIPYIWLWTEGLDGIVRAAMVVAHATALLAVATASTAVDCRRGVMPRLGLLRGSRRCRLDLAPTLAQVLTLLALAAIAAVAATEVPLALPGALTLLLAAGWAWVKLPLSVKYLAGPDWVGPLLVLVAPAAAIAWFTPASPPPSTVFAGTAFLVATVLATHLRDRADDLAADIPTAATRRPLETRNWMWLTTAAGSLTILTGMYTPLAVPEWIGIIGALGCLVAAGLRELRVPLLVAFHALIGLYLLVG